MTPFSFFLSTSSQRFMSAALSLRLWLEHFRRFVRLSFRVSGAKPAHRPKPVRRWVGFL
jgi:hypothetical protein